MAAISRENVVIILTTIRNRGGKTTLGELFSDLEEHAKKMRYRDLEGLHQLLLKNAKINAFVSLGSELGEEKTVRLTKLGNERGPLFSWKNST
jgi:hypothetical protein